MTCEINGSLFELVVPFSCHKRYNLDLKFEAHVEVNCQLTF